MLIKLTEKRGFTLIELMIVVAVIGILAAIAIPNFLRFLAKSKQAEVRSNLSAIYTTETTYFTENNTYATTFEAIKWVPEGTTRYEYFLSPSETTGSISGLTIPAEVAVSSTGFTAGATGNIDTETTVYDMWTINDKKTLTNVTNDVTSD